MLTQREQIEHKLNDLYAEIEQVQQSPLGKFHRLIAGLLLKIEYHYTMQQYRLLRT